LLPDGIRIRMKIPILIMKSIAFPSGGLILIDRVDKRFGVFSEVFSGLGGRSKDFVGCIKLHVYNKLTYSVSTHQIPKTYPKEVAAYLGMYDMPAERSLYRAFERLGKRFPLALERYQSLLKKHDLVDSNQVSDFSSVYFEGKNAELGEPGFSRDHRPDRPQVNFGITTGINGIPTALTIQKGNVQDKKHMQDMLNVVGKVLPEKSLLIFDNGANTKQNKAKILKMRFHYLTLKAKKVKVYAKHINEFKNSPNVSELTLNERHYKCVKIHKNDESLYVFFCQELYEDQVYKRQKKFKKQKKKGDKILAQRKPEKIPSKKGWVELEPHLQKTIHQLEYPYINGTEGYFILESSVDEDPEKILRLYKERDKAEKLCDLRRARPCYDV